MHLGHLLTWWTLNSRYNTYSTMGKFTGRRLDLIWFSFCLVRFSLMHLAES
jgi:hypothetical protein